MVKFSKKEIPTCGHKRRNQRQDDTHAQNPIGKDTGGLWILKGFSPFILYLLYMYFLFHPGIIVSQNPVKREFRGVWVATVYNIDWPSEYYLTTEEQIREMQALINRMQELGFNTLLLQIRPCADAFYPNPEEPWSKYLTGVQGKAPEPYYNPLDSFISECHRRGMELHAWINPFRIRMSLKDSLVPWHVANRHPEWVVNYGNQSYFDPGIPEVRQWLAGITSYLIRNYAIDGIHFDDYFYPYPIQDLEFPDSLSFLCYGSGFSENAKADWRRANINSMIRLLHDTIRKLDPQVKFGISPFGVWRNRTEDSLGSETTAQTTNYDHLYADVLEWLKQGWIDYITPQLYWEIGHEAADFKTLARWWNMHTYGRQLYIGFAPYRINKKSEREPWRTGDQLVKQMVLARSLENVQGACFFSYRNFLHPMEGFRKELKKDLYHHKAIPPSIPWMDTVSPSRPEKPVVIKQGRTYSISWKEHPPKDSLRAYALYIVPENKKLDQQNAEHIYSLTGEDHTKFRKPFILFFKKYRVAASVFDQNWNESELSEESVF